MIHFLRVRRTKNEIQGRDKKLPRFGFNVPYAPILIVIVIVMLHPQITFNFKFNAKKWNGGGGGKEALPPPKPFIIVDAISCRGLRMGEHRK
jgi:hypothetical protein